MAVRERPKAVSLTEAAAERVKGLMAQRGAGFLRVGVKNGGCAGMEYEMAYVEAPGPLDERVEDPWRRDRAGVEGPAIPARNADRL